MIDVSELSNIMFSRTFFRLGISIVFVCIVLGVFGISQALTYGQDVPVGFETQQVKTAIVHPSGGIVPQILDQSVASPGIIARVSATNSIKARNSPLFIDHSVAGLQTLNSIPNSAINDAKNQLHIAYGHTSHGSQITTGMTGLVHFGGTDVPSTSYQWAETPQPGYLDIDDYFVPGDLGNPDFTTWASRTRTYLNNPVNADVNVVMWSWCGQVSGASASQISTYLNLMNQLEIDYPHITFVYMTGHLDGTGVNGNLNQRNEQIRDFCGNNNKVLYDFADIESYDPDNQYYLDRAADDGCNYNGGNWAISWQNSHVEGVEWYSCGAAHTEPLNANLKAYAAWYLFARLGGWNGNEAPTITSISPSTGVNTGPVTATITGTNFVTGTSTVTLTSGQSAITATDVNYVSPTQITCTLLITGAAAGIWNVVLTTGGLTVTKENGFLITDSGTLDLIGNYKQDSGIWTFDVNRNGQWDGPSVDYLGYFGGTGNTPVVADMNGDGYDTIGNYKPESGIWTFDVNRNGQWDGPSVDYLGYFGGPGNTPVVADLNGDGYDEIGNYKPDSGIWTFDVNRNGQWDGPSVDYLGYFGGPGNTPVIADINGDGYDEIGNYKPDTRIWTFDVNRNRLWDGPSIDYFGYFGETGNTPVVADINGDRYDEIGNYKPDSGIWTFDVNRNGLWDGSSVDYIGSFGGPGNSPVVAKLHVSGTTSIQSIEKPQVNIPVTKISVPYVSRPAVAAPVLEMPVRSSPVVSPLIGRINPGQNPLTPCRNTKIV